MASEMWSLVIFSAPAKSAMIPSLEITWHHRGKGGNSNQRIELMAALTLDRVLTEAEALPADEQEMLESLLRQRRIETWRQETAAAAKSAIKAFRSGKLTSKRERSKNLGGSVAPNQHRLA
jgi:hypothetical protein